MLWRAAVFYTSRIWTPSWVKMEKSNIYRNFLPDSRKYACFFLQCACCVECGVMLVKSWSTRKSCYGFVSRFISVFLFWFYLYPKTVLSIVLDNFVLSLEFKICFSLPFQQIHISLPLGITFSSLFYLKIVFRRYLVWPLSVIISWCIMLPFFGEYS